MMHYIDLLPLDESSFDYDRVEGYVCRFTLRGSLGLDNSYELALLVKTLAAGGMQRIILNMEHLNYVDSTGIGMIIRLKKELVSHGGCFILYNVPPKINEVFELVNLKEFVPIAISESKVFALLRDPDLAP